MSLRLLRVSAAIATFCVLVIAQLQDGAGSAGLESPDTTGNISLPTTAILTIRGNRPVTLNGAIAISGATILSGALLETPDKVAATISLRSLGTIDMAPATTVTLVFTQRDTFKVVLVKGCASLHALKRTIGEISAPQGVSEKTDPNTGGSVSYCFPQTAHRPADVVVDRFDREGLFGLGTAAAAAVIGGRIGAAEGVTAGRRGSNPGPSSP